MIKSFRKNCREKLMHESDCFINAATGIKQHHDTDCDAAAENIFNNLVKKALFYEILTNLICK